MSASTSIFSTRRSRRASARPCRAARPIARRISSWSSCTIQGWCAPSTSSSSIPFSTNVAAPRVSRWNCSAACSACRSPIVRRLATRYFPTAVEKRSNRLPNQAPCKSSALGGVAGDQVRIAGRGIGHGGPDLGCAGRGKREFAVADAKRRVLDQDLLVLNGRAALVFHLRAKAVDLRNRELEFLVVRIGPLPAALVARGIDIGVRRVGCRT